MPDWIGDIKISRLASKYLLADHEPELTFSNEGLYLHSRGIDIGTVSAHAEQTLLDVKTLHNIEEIQDPLWLGVVSRTRDYDEWSLIAYLWNIRVCKNLANFALEYHPLPGSHRDKKSLYYCFRMGGRLVK